MRYAVSDFLLFMFHIYKYRLQGVFAVVSGLPNFAKTQLITTKNMDTKKKTTPILCVSRMTLSCCIALTALFLFSTAVKVRGS